MDRLAPLYELQLGLERRTIGAALDLLAPQADDRVLDIGTGTGAVLQALATLPSPPAEAIGLDRSWRMLAQVPDLPASWRLAQGDAAALPLPDGHVTAVTAVYLLHLLERPDVDRAIAEVRRVLRPGGRVVVAAPAVPRGGLARPYRALVAALSPFSRTSLGLRPLDPGPVLERHGLPVRRVRRLSRGYPSLCALAQRPVERRPRARR